MESRNVTVIGLQWGDEGKGKIVDALARLSKYVVRFCGGANAGHTIKVAGEKYALHLIPSGILHPDIRNVVGNGVVFDPQIALGEIDELLSRGVAIGPENLFISQSANVVMPYHKLADSLSESLLGGGKIGTTGRGIGPCYADKASRTTAIRVGELTEPDSFAAKIRKIVELKNKMFVSVYGADPLDPDAIVEQYIGFARRLTPMICDTGSMLRAAIEAGEPILFEGAQGSMLDVDHGTYPFVTSSSVSACGVASGAGVPPSAVGRVVGVIKSYTSRVGAGPFPTEQDNETGHYLREQGEEYGTTTGRARRCGWFDAFAVRYAADLSGVDKLALSSLDVLSGLKEVKICTGYRVAGKMVEQFNPDLMPSAQCIYETLPGWTEQITTSRSFDELPSQAQAYVNRLEELLARPVGFISVGPQRNECIVHNMQIEGVGQ